MISDIIKIKINTIEYMHNKIENIFMHILI